MLLPMRRLCGLLCVAALAFAGSAGAVLNGTFDGGAHPYVGLVSDGSIACSGFLVGPRTFVTAGHCFADGAAVHGANDASPTKPTWTGVAHRDPSYCCGIDNPQTHDLAVVTLDQAQPRPYAKLAALGAVAKLPKKGSVTAVGYGVSGFTNGGGKPAPLASFQRSFATLAVGNTGNDLSAEFFKLGSSASGNNAGACYGDSGGPDLLPGTDVAVGLTSFGSNSICSGPSYAYRLDTPDAQRFISQFLR
jgi:secreted trypsin-like serine protease